MGLIYMYIYISIYMWYMYCWRPYLISVCWCLISLFFWIFLVDMNDWMLWGPPKVILLDKNSSQQEGHITPWKMNGGFTYQSPMNWKEHDLFTKPPGNYVPAVNLQGYMTWVVPNAQDSSHHGTSQDFFQGSYRPRCRLIWPRASILAKGGTT